MSAADVVSGTAIWEPASLYSFVFGPFRFFFCDFVTGAGGGAPGTARGVRVTGVSGISVCVEVKVVDGELAGDSTARAGNE